MLEKEIIDSNHRSRCRFRRTAPAERRNKHNEEQPTDERAYATRSLDLRVGKAHGEIPGKPRGHLCSVLCATSRASDAQTDFNSCARANIEFWATTGRQFARNRFQ